MATGVLSGFGASRFLRVAGAGPLLGIDATGLPNGTRMSLSFVDGLTITANATLTTGAKILIDHVGTASLVCPADAVVDFVLLRDSGAFAFWMFAGGSLGGTGGGSSTPSNSIPCAFGDTYPTISTSPEVKAQCMGDFDGLTAGSIPVELNAWAQVDVGYTGTVAVLVGGDKDTADGTTVLTQTITGTGTYAPITISASVTNPAGKLPIKLVLSSSDAAHVMLVQGVTLVIGVGSAGAHTGGGGGTWGSITGALSAQTDLASALAGKLATTDPSVTNARTPTAHASTHGTAGSDPITIAESQVTNLATDLAAKEPGLGNPSVTGYVLSSTTGGARSWVAQTGGGGASNWDGGQANTNYGGTIAINGGTA
jgi:hypothetical protein